MSLSIYISRTYESYRKVAPIVSGKNWGFIVRHLETVIVLVLFALNNNPQRLNHSLSLFRSRFWYSATVTLMPRDRGTGIKEESSAQPISLFPRMESISEVTGGTIMAENTAVHSNNRLPQRAVIDMTETVSTHEAPIPTEQSL